MLIVSPVDSPRRFGSLGAVLRQLIASGFFLAALHLTSTQFSLSIRMSSHEDIKARLQAELQASYLARQQLEADVKSIEEQERLSSQALIACQREMQSREIQFQEDREAKNQRVLVAFENYRNQQQKILDCIVAGAVQAQVEQQPPL